MQDGKFNLWVFGDAHVGTDLKHGRESLAEALLMSEKGGRQGGPSIAWDIAIDVGDMSGGHEVPTDDEGAEVVRQLEDCVQQSEYKFTLTPGESGKIGRNETASSPLSPGVRQAPGQF